MKLNVVAPRTGLQWVRNGIRTFGRQPLALLGLFFMYFAGLSLLAALPVAGPVLAFLLVPTLTVGLLAATVEAEAGRFPFPSILVVALRQGERQRRDMLVLGLLYAVLGTLCSLLVEALAGDTAVVGPGTAPSVGVIALVLLVNAPLLLLFWHAPALVHWHGVSPAKSLFFSAVACWRNLGAMVVFALAWTGVFLAAGAVLSLAGLLGAEVLRVAMLPAALLLAAMFSTSIWSTFRDSFSADVPAPATTPEILP